MRAGGLLDAEEPRATLYELFLDAASPQEATPGLLALITQRMAAQDILLVHHGAEMAGLQQDSVHTPQLAINRTTRLPFASARSMGQSLAAATAGELEASWSVSLYLSVKLTPQGEHTVDFAVCNLEEKRTFNGRYVVWVAERVEACGGGDAFWEVRQMLTSGVIAELPQAETRGCPMPEHFTLPPEHGHGRVAVVGAVMDTEGEVQAAAMEIVP